MTEHTICVNCIHHRSSGWTWTCKKAPNQVSIDYITGSKMYIGAITKKITLNEYEYCDYINTNGKCKYYEEEESDIMNSGDKRGSKAKWNILRRQRRGS